MKILTFTYVTVMIMAFNVMSIIRIMFLFTSMFPWFTKGLNLGSAVKAVPHFSYFNIFSLLDRRWHDDVLDLRRGQVVMYLR